MIYAIEVLYFIEAESREEATKKVVNEDDFIDKHVMVRPASEEELNSIDKGEEEVYTEEDVNSPLIEEKDRGNTISLAELPAFEAEYNKAVSSQATSFKFKGGKVLVSYARYVIEYLKGV